eukprot:m.113874 g.113874  ORF g.113874 m.113874 type:complete len:52 (+) comp13529_c0_seq2:1388-1543(+)
MCVCVKEGDIEPPTVAWPLVSLYCADHFSSSFPNPQLDQKGFGNRWCTGAC